VFKLEKIVDQFSKELGIERQNLLQLMMGEQRKQTSDSNVLKSISADNTGQAASVAYNNLVEEGGTGNNLPKGGKSRNVNSSFTEQSRGRALERLSERRGESESSFAVDRGFGESSFHEAMSESNKLHFATHMGIRHQPREGSLQILRPGSQKGSRLLSNNSSAGQTIKLQGINRSEERPLKTAQ